jgi:hypothetical protein
MAIHLQGLASNRERGDSLMSALMPKFLAVEPCALTSGSARGGLVRWEGPASGRVSVYVLGAIQLSNANVASESEFVTLTSFNFVTYRLVKSEVI